MDYATLNALAIAGMAAFGLWIFSYAAKKQKNAVRKGRKAGR